MAASPQAKLEEIARCHGIELMSKSFAELMDSQDELKEFRDRFEFPTLGSIPCETIGDPDEKVTYLIGNSLGLKPKTVDKYMKEQMESWGKNGIFMHTTGRVPAAHADQPGKPMIAKIVGAKDESEVCILNGLTVNLQFLMLAFYKPQGIRNKILIEDHAFPSDRYAALSLMKLMNVPEDRLIKLKPRKGQDTLRTEDIIKCIEDEKDELALVMLPGVQYYTGQKFNMPAITKVAKALGIPVGFDLAHAVGNVELKLHEWNVDFAAWCSYKYLNSGPGGIGGIFLHKNHHKTLPNHLVGWWANKAETRFDMLEDIDESVGAEAFRLSNPPPFLAAPHLASLEIFDEAGMEKVISKQFLLTGYLEYLLKSKFSGQMRIITPSNHEERGCQLSLCFNRNVDEVNGKLMLRGALCDTRGDVIRVGPAPLYNSFQDVWKFVNILGQCL